MNPDDARTEHARYCNCTPAWLRTDTGQALSCGKEEVLIWWPTVDASQLDDAHRAALFCIAPMLHDDDGDGANNKLLTLGYHQITPANFDDAKKALNQAYEKELWQDNIGKQLLGRLFDDDLT